MTNPNTPITLEPLGLDSWDALYALDTAEVIRLMTEKDVPVHPGDAFLAVMAVSAIDKLDRASRKLLCLTWALVLLAGLTLAAAIVTLVAS